MKSLNEIFGRMRFGYWDLLTRRINTYMLRKAVIPANTLKGTGAVVFTCASNIKGLSGCRIKSGMTSYLIAGVIVSICNLLIGYSK